MTKLYLAIVFYFHLESFVFLLMYHVQDNIGADNVFYAIHTIYAAFDIFILVSCVQSDLGFQFRQDLKPSGGGSLLHTLQELHRSS